MCSSSMFQPSALIRRHSGLVSEGSAKSTLPLCSTDNSDNSQALLVVLDQSQRYLLTCKHSVIAYVSY